MNSRYIHLGFPVTTPPSVYRLTYYGGGADVQAFSDANAFIGKFNSSGTSQWITLVGGPNYSRFYGVVVDGLGNVYATGRSGKSLQTVNAMQPNFAGSDPGGGSYGPQCGFLAKVNSNGEMQWLTYVGTSELCRDIAISSDGSFVVVPLSYLGTGDHAGNSANCPWGAAALSGAYQAAPTAFQNAGCVKINSDGSAVCATYIGGNANSSLECQVLIDPDGSIYLMFFTSATDLTVTSGNRTKSAGVDLYICKFNSTLTSLLWGTYLGGSGDEYPNTHHLALDGNGNLFVHTWTNSTNWPTTVGVYMHDYPTGATNTCGIAKLNSTNGNLIAATYFGGTGSDNPDGIAIDASGNVWFGNATSSTDMPVTANAYQGTYGGGTFDGAIVALSNDLTSLVYSSFFGGNAGDQIRSIGLSADGNKVFVVGETDGGTFPILNAYQSSYGGVPGGDPGYGSPAGDAIIAGINLVNNPTTLIFSTFLGGTHWDMARGIFVGANDYLYVVGGTHSHDFPTDQV